MIHLPGADLIADAQSDRRIPPNEKPGRLRIIEDRDDGIVVYGSKVAGSIGNIAHFFTLSTTLGKGLGEDAAIWAGVPVDSENLTLLMREPLAWNDANPEDHPLDVRGEEVDNYIMFDKVFIPREYLFSARNINLLGLYFESCAHALWHILARLAVRAQIFAGCAQAIVDILGTEGNQGVRNSVTEVILYAAATRSFVLASIEEAVDWNGVITPHPATVTAGRLYSIENYPRIQYLLKDLCGQGIVSRFPSAVWDHPEFAEKLEEFLPGTGVTAREKNRFFNFVYDLTCGSHANRVGQFENVNATPRYFISELVYQHYDRADWAKFVREIEHAMSFERWEFLDTGRVQSQEFEIEYLSLRSTASDGLRLEFSMHKEGLLPGEQPLEDIGIFIPAGEYSFNRHSVGLRSAGHRPFSVGLNISDGGYFNGERLHVSPELEWVPNQHLNFSLEYSYDKYEFPGASAITRQITFGNNIAFNSKSSLMTLAQYDNVSDELGLNVRFRYNQSAGRDIWLVLNHNWIDDPVEDRFRSTASTVAAKIRFTFRY